MKTRWLITGGCGFIGRNLVKNLIAEGYNAVRLIDNLSVGTRQDLAQVCDFYEIASSTINSMNEPASRIELVVGDVRDAKLALAAAKGADVIVHLAANTGVEPSVQNPRMDCEVNVIGTLNYLEAARHNKVKRFVFASSGAPVGECEPPIHEELAPHPVSPYGASKLAGEGYCSAYYRTFGVETVALRFGNVYGPLSDHKSSIVAKFIRQAMKGQSLEIFGSGNQTRDFIYIDDLMRAIRLAASRENIGGEIFQIATNAETSVNELTDMLIPIMNGSGFQNIDVHYSRPRKGDVSRNFSDTSKAKNRLGWQSKVHLKEGLDLTVRWFASLDLHNE